MQEFLTWISDLYYLVFGSKKLRSYESLCLNVWRSRLTPLAQSILDRQLSAYHYVQRYSDGKLVCFYSATDREGKKWDADMFFPLKDKESGGPTVATVHLSLKDGTKRKIRADIIFADNGRFLGFNFSMAPSKFFGSKNLDSAEANVSGVEIWRSPMKSIAPKTSAESGIKLKGWLAKTKYHSTRKPLPKDAQESILKTVDGRLPVEYLKLNNQTDGLTVNGVKVNGLRGVWKIVLPEDENFYVIADENEGRQLAIKQGDVSGELYLLDNESGGPTSPLKISFKDFILHYK